MSDEELFYYTVVLVFPGFGSEREYAEQVVEAALDHLNIPRYEPGIRFAPNVRARLDIVSNVDQALASLENDEDIATMILHDLDEDDRERLIDECAERGLALTVTMETGGDRPKKSRGKKEGFTFELRKREENRPSVHQIADSVLTAPPDDDQDWSNRVGQVMFVVAVSVMGFHFARHPSPIRRYIDSLKNQSKPEAEA